MEQGSIGIAIDMDSFNILMKARKPKTLEYVTRGTGADTVLLGILLSKHALSSLIDAIRSSSASLAWLDWGSERSWGRSQEA